MKGTSRGGPLSMLADSADRVCRVQLLTAPGGICWKEGTARSCLEEGSIVDVSFSPYFGGAGATSLDLPVNGGPAGWTLFHGLAPAFHTPSQSLFPGTQINSWIPMLITPWLNDTMSIMFLSVQHCYLDCVHDYSCLTRPSPLLFTLHRHP